MTEIMTQPSPVQTSRPARSVWAILLLLGRLVLGAIFVYAAYAKLRNPWMLFGMSLDSYHMFPDWATEPVARIMPWIEMFLGLMLLTGWWLR